MVARQLPVDGRFNGQPTGQHPDLSAVASLTEPAMTTESRALSPAFNSSVLAILALDGVLCAVATALLLPAHLGAAPFPVSAVIGGVVNTGLVWLALQCTASLRVAALPMWTWLVTIAAMTVGGPGGDLIFAGSGVLEYGVLLMMVAGSAGPGWLLWHRSRQLAAGLPAGRR